MGSRSIKSESKLRYVDWVTVLIYLILVTVGAISIYAASYDFDNASIFSFDEFSGKQIRWIGLSLVLGLVLLLIDSRVYETYAYPVYVIVMLILAVTPLLAHDIKGSLSWINFGPMSLQPAEFGKFATALALAKVFGGYNFSLNAKPSNYVRVLVIILLPIALILAQKETGSSLVYLALFFVLYREGMSGMVLLSALLAIVIFVLALKYSDLGVMGMTYGELSVYVIIMCLMVVMLAVFDKRLRIAGNVFLFFTGCGILMWILTSQGVELPGNACFIGVLAIASVYCAYELLKDYTHKLMLCIATPCVAVIFLFSVNFFYNDVMEPHQQMRIKVALGIENDIKKYGYNVNQSKIAIGSGGLTGKGFLEGTQTKLKFVPEQHTDFIFCTIGEEEGFIGSVAVLALFLVLILRIISIAERQPSVFGRVYAYCVASYFIFHFCINIGMVIGLCPVIGIPLPFLSYGGSSLWGFTLLLFILLRIDASRKARHAVARY